MNFLYILIVALCLNTFAINAQKTFSHQYDIGVGNGNLSIEFYQMDSIFKVITGHICNTSVLGDCFSVSDFNYNGDLLSYKLVEGIQASDENIISINGDTMFIFGANSANGYDSFFVIKGDIDFNEYNVQEYLEGDNITYILVGVLEYSDNFYTYGQSINNEISYGHIIKWDSTFSNILNHTLVQNDGSFDAVIDLQPTPDGNFAYINDAASTFSDRYIAKIDKNGFLIDEYVYMDLSNKMKANLLVSSDGYYYYAQNSDPFDNSTIPVLTGHIIKLDKNLNDGVWTLPLPSVFGDFRDYDVYDIIETQNGDIVICGRVFDEDEFTTDWSGFISRISPEGEIIWLHMYKIPNELNSELYGYYNESYLYEVEETAAGGFIAIGSSFQNLSGGQNNLQKLWILSIDQNGCLDQYGCDENLILTSSEDITYNNHLIKIYPNPTSDYLNISIREGTPNRSTQFRIVNIEGVVLETLQHTVLDITYRLPIKHLPTGIYSLQYLDKGMVQYSEQFIIHR